MDTNLVNALVNALAAQKAPSDFWYQVVPALAAALFAAASYLKSRTAVAVATETKQLATATTNSVGKIETEVNSKASAMITKMDGLEKEVQRLRGELSFQEGKTVEKEKAATVEQAVAKALEKA